MSDLARRKIKILRFSITGNFIAPTGLKKTYFTRSGKIETLFIPGSNRDSNFMSNRNIIPDGSVTANRLNDTMDWRQKYFPIVFQGIPIRNRRPSQSIKNSKKNDTGQGLVTEAPVPKSIDPYEEKDVN
jgi:hypothetical protein